ncbi:hypothetical protein [Enterococcus larvae]|uniref:hypothetical protein n=1 Tax=Enterococcus larvae TaxID=2794352 RepID=UPI003F3A87DB
MEKIKLNSSKKFSGTAKELKEKFEEKVDIYQTPTTYSNTEAPLLWIIRGSIKYFDKLDTKFLGIGNESGIPSMKADYFANNTYRLINAIDYLAELWKLKIEKSDELKFLLDIRTLIVHSGEPINKVESLKLEGYKDSQLGRIFPRKECIAFPFPEEYSDMDYCIEVWNDKHDKTKKHNLSKVDHHVENESYCDTGIYLKSSDVRDIMLCHIGKFIDCGNKTKQSQKVKKLPNIKAKVIDMESDTIDFDKIADLISKDLRGGYFKERGIEYWDGFGLKRLYDYSKKHLGALDKVRVIIKEEIHTVMSKYWDDYQDENLTIDDLPNLDIRTVFTEFTPEFEYKGYLEGEKLFNHIAPFFNTRNYSDKRTDVGYLNMFIGEVGNALGTELSIGESVDDLVCDYFIQSIRIKIDRNCC